MADLFPGDHDVLMVFAAAHLRGTATEPVGTDHLLVGLATVGPTVPVLDAVELTATVARLVARQRSGTWVSTDGPRTAPSESVQLVMASGGTPASFTPAAARAMRRAAAVAATTDRATCSPTDILIALLADPDNRAVEMLRHCGTDTEALTHSLQNGEPLAVADRVDPELRRLRDVLIGRVHYHGRGWRHRLMSLSVRGGGYAARPTTWAALEARELAAEAGRRRAGTDDLVLAILATHEVGQLYPHLTQRTHAEPDGGQLLAGAGLRYRDTHRLARKLDLGADPRPLAALFPTLPDSTTTLVRRILGGTDNRATRLLARTGIDLTRLS